MKCPSCRLTVNDDVKKCPDCGFSLSDIGKRITRLPRKSGRLIDGADILEEEYANRIFAYLLRFSARTGAEFYCVTVPDCGKILPTEYAFYFLNHYSIGGPAHRGLVLLLSLRERSICCEVGYSLENILTDAEAEDILKRDAVPLLAGGRYEEALHAACVLLGDTIMHGRSRWRRFWARIKRLFDKDETWEA